MAQHLSIRVPWHDSGWKGTVCCEPTTNMSCLRLKNIHENRDDDVECELCGQCLVGHEESIPCIGEGGAFMSEDALHKVTVHPYKKYNFETHKHFLETEVVYPAYSFPARPFAWLMREDIEKKAELYGIEYNPNREPRLDFKTSWVQDAENHRAIFKYFYQDVIPDQSLCIAYAKQVPFVEDNRRVIIGMGHVKRVVPAIEHKHTEAGKLRSMIWETMVCHSIRENHKDGFVIPYQEMMKYAETHPAFDLSTITVFAPADAFDEFSYATEHVSHDAVIDVILSCIKSFSIINECLDEDYTDVLSWLNEQFDAVWEDRGAFPGLGPMLTAFGITLGIPMARELKAGYQVDQDFWEYVDAVFQKPEEHLSANIAASIKPINKQTWKSMSKERKELFELLSRFSLNIDQAKILFYQNERIRNRINCSDQEIIENPYILYEQTRLKQEQLYLSVQKVDRAVFPVPSVAEKYPLMEPTKLQSDNDARRIRAIAISVLEDAANAGNTFLPCNLLIDKIQAMTLEPACLVTSDMIAAIEQFMSPEIMKREMRDGTEYYKLVRLNEFDLEIEKRVKKRLNAEKIPVDANWRQRLDERFKEFDNGEPITEIENAARNEKAAVLKVLAESRISVLVGDAGTGKTTVLSVLCSHPAIAAGGVLLLAPTGKATVRLMESVGVAGKKFTAYNVAQFLTKSKRFDWNDMRFMLSNQPYKDLPETVIVDEASMLTEEMFGALLQTIAGAKRIIIVGDPNQLPPIGAGKPFVDLVNLLREDLPATPFGQPRVCNCYGELRINRRQQKGTERLDVTLSRHFTRTEELDDAGDIISEIVQGKSEHIQLEQWTTREELEDKLLSLVARELNMSGSDDQKGFDRALGATITQYETFFNRECAEYADKWQVLAPVRNMPHGVININRLFHQKYRSHQLELSRRDYKKCIPPALGDEEIVYGDKVINVQNIKKEAYPNDGHAMNYVANGEIGIACGIYKTGLKNNNSLKVCFSSQTGYTYPYEKRDFDDEAGSAGLELAYALTVHKSQGSQFGTVILVLTEPCSIISRELLYTALTRQVGKIIILYNQEPYHLMKYSSEIHSDIAKRFTDLFADVFSDDGGKHKPQITKVGDSFFDEKLIHKTVRGELVRSKSEVIIANALFYNGLSYEYEPELELEGKIKRPDFKIVDADTGMEWYWEHCGMMSDVKYAKRWEDKEKFYAKNGIVRGKNLIVTEERAGEGLNSGEIDELIKQTFDL